MAAQQRVRKKRKWDEPPPEVKGEHSAGGMSALLSAAAAKAASISAQVTSNGVAAPSLGEGGVVDMKQLQAAALQAAARITAQVNATTAQKSASDNSTPANSEFVKEIEINDSSERSLLVRSSFHQDIYQQTGAGVTSRGRYFLPAEPRPAADGSRPLHLHISAPSAESLAKAVSMIEHNMGPAPQDLMDKIVVVADHAMLPPGQAIASVRGPNGSYLAHIEQTASVRLQVQGRGTVISPQVHPYTFATCTPMVRIPRSPLQS